MVKNISLRPLAFAILFALPFLWHFFGVAHQDIEEIDETAWVFSSYYYRLAFIENSFSNPDWQDLDALDHPPLAKYTFGFAFFFAGLVPDNLAEKVWWRTHDLDMLDREGFLRRQTERTPPRALLIGRFVSTVFLIACAFLVYSVSINMTSPVIALSAGLLFALNPLAQQVSGLVVADGIFLFFLLGSIFTQQKLFSRLAAGQSAPLLSPITGACAALLFLTKITGLAELPIALAGLLLAGRCGPDGKVPTKFLIRSGVAILLSWAFVSYVSNPSWWPDPLGFVVKMFRYRLDRVGLQMGVFFGDALPSPLLSLSVALHRIFFEWDGCYVAFKVPALLILTSFGLVQSLLSLRKAGPAERVLLLNAATWIPITIAAFKLEWDRYLLPIVPFVAVCAARGLGDFYRFLTSPRTPRLLTAVGLSLTLTLVLGAFSGTFTRASYELRHADWFRAAQGVHLRKQLEFHPDNPTLWLELAKLDEALGNGARAKQDWLEYFRAAEMKPREPAVPAN